MTEPIAEPDDATDDAELTPNPVDIVWDLGELGTRTGRITPSAIMEIERLHGGIVGLARRYMTGQGGFAETVSIVWATLLASEGASAPDREQIVAAVYSGGLGAVLSQAGEVCRRVLGGFKDSEVGLH